MQSRQRVPFCAERITGGCVTVDIERIGDWCTLYHADSGGVFLDLYLANPAVLVTDPPYGNANSFGKMAFGPVARERCNSISTVRVTSRRKS